MCKTAEIYIDDKRIVCRVGQTLGECLSLDIPCGGHGKCGKCKIRAFGSISPISEIEKVFQDAALTSIGKDSLVGKMLVEEKGE